MSEQNEPLEARLRRLVSDAVEDAPRPPAVEEMASPTSTPLPTTSSTTRRWVAGGAIGIAAALVAALIVLPDRHDAAVPLDSPNETVVEPSPTVPVTTAPEATTPAVPDAESPVRTTPSTSQETTTVPITRLAAPTHATTFPTDTREGDVDADIAPADAIDLSDATIFGLGFGTPADPDEAIARLGTAVGPPTFDTGWKPKPADFGEPWAECFGPLFRTVWFGDFRITFEETGGSGVRVGAWSVGDPAVDGSAPVGDLPADREASGVSANGVGVGASREAVLAVVPQDGRIIRDDEDGVAVTGAIVTSFDIDDQDVVTGIGSGRLDCTVGAN